MSEYVGRLACDGDGNLLAHEAKQVGTKLVQVHDADGEPVYDDAGNEITLEVPIFKYGKNHGKAVAYDPDKDCYVFVADGEPSHNERFHENEAHIVGTQAVDPDLPGYAGTVDEPAEGTEHHFGVLPDDPHYHGGAALDGVITNTKIVNDSDKVAVKAASHTHQHKDGA
jgi:hypothetical protein